MSAFIFSTKGYAFQPHSVTKVETGITVILPKGTYGRIVGRSSLALHGITTAAGVIDRDYRGEIVVVIYNITNITFYVKKHERIAQIVLEKYSNKQPRIRYDLPPGYETDRGTGGFGSTGKF